MRNQWIADSSKPEVLSGTARFDIDGMHIVIPLESFTQFHQMETLFQSIRNKAKSKAKRECLAALQEIISTI